VGVVRGPFSYNKMDHAYLPLISHIYVWIQRTQITLNGFVGVFY